MLIVYEWLNVMFKPNEGMRLSNSNMTKIARPVESNAGWTDAHTGRGKYLIPLWQGHKIILQYIQY